MSTETFSPTRYPYTYAADYLRTNPHVIPTAIREAAEDREWQREGQGFGALLSRAQASAIREHWATELGRDDDDLAREHADRFLAANGIVR